MHRRLLILFAWLATVAGTVASAAGASANPPLVVAITDTAQPFSYRDANGKLAGFNVDIALALCRQMQRSCRFDIHPFPEILPRVAAGQADIGLGNYLRTPAREQQVSFSIPYWHSTSSFIGLRTLHLPSLAQLPQQYRICVTRGSKQFAFLQTLAGGRTDALVVTAGNQEAFDSLVGKQCALVLVPTLQGLNFLQSTVGAGYTYVGAPLAQEGLGGSVHLISRPDDTHLKDQIDNALKNIIADGSHNRISRKYFPFDIF